MRVLFAVPVLLLLTGCLGAPARQTLPPLPTSTFESPRGAGSVADCLLQRLPGDYELYRIAPWHYVVSLPATDTAPAVRWDVLATDGGSRVTFPTPPQFADERATARACAGVAGG